jgi:CrcB protein
MNLIIAIFLGGGAGAVMRHYAVIAARGIAAGGFPYGTLFVNVAGSLLVGILMEMASQKANVTPQTQALLVTGFLGGFTTFSAFSFDVYKLANTGQAVQAAAYVAASVFLSLLAVFAGAYLVKGFSA